MKHKAKFFFLFPLIAAAGLFLIGIVVMLLWNALLPAVFGLSTITFWQALGLFILCKLLFGFGGKGGYGGPGRWWSMKMKHKMRNMSPEERQRFKEEMFNRMNCWKSRNEHSFNDFKEQSNPAAAES
ncbi:hypothetical protein [Rubrolithibacter danxiaensis]|uniref:hypothetical protein n=1 Tax=Rubrolithibacter danxiaensis TaxID=3390805 RepID=UPI003BF8E8D3